MKIRVSPGYTNVEVMIVLAVTSALFAMVALTFQGRQARTEFSVATREVESQISDIVNDVETGYYGGMENIICTDDGKKLSIGVSPGGVRGKNGDCMFVGKIIQFGVDKGDNKAFNVYSIAAARLEGGEPASSYPGTHPAIIEPATDRRSLPAGLTYG